VGSTKRGRQIINGIFYRIRTGCPWRDIPERYGLWHRIYAVFSSLSKQGTWKKIHHLLLSERHLGYDPLETISLDSTTIRGHIHAAVGLPLGGGHRIKTD
jgi:hypothetical protein